jgi:hypothetical protein
MNLLDHYVSLQEKNIIILPADYQILMYGIERETTGTFMFSKFLIRLVSNPSPVIRETCLWIARYSVREETSQGPIYHPPGCWTIQRSQQPWTVLAGL